MPSAYQKWTRAQARQIVQRELLDTSSRWWTDSELNYYIESWQNEVQEQLELIWGSNTQTTVVSTFTLSTFTPGVQRLDAVYYNNWRLSPRSYQNLDDLYREWRDPNFTSNPRVALQYDARTFVIWPPLVTTGTVYTEYVKKLTLPTDNSSISLPPWAQICLKPYVCARAFARPGANNDLAKAKRYVGLFKKKLHAVRLLKENYTPDRFRRLRPAGKYEMDILKPPPAQDLVMSMPVLNFAEYSTYNASLVGVVDGSNTVFTMPITPSEVQVFLNGQLQQLGLQYTWSGPIITFVTPPQTGDIVIAFTFRS